MKRFFIYTLICSLTALMGCDKNDEVMNDLATTNGKKVTVTANIQGDAATRVTLTPDNTDPTKPFVKVDWKASGETFKAYAQGEETPIVFTQTADTEDSKNLFEGTLNGTAPYTLYYGDKDYDLSTQNGTLNEAYVLMQATTDFSTTIDFAHKTAILKPTFEVGNAALATNTITKIVMGGIKKPTATTESGSITVTPSALDDIYIFLPAFESYTAGHTFTFNVIVGGLNYQATLTIPDSRSIEAGKFYTADITIALAGTPYLTFTAQGAQTFKMNTEFEYTLPNTLQYSLDGNTWETLTAGDEISFDEDHPLRLRGKSSTGTATSAEAYSKIVFGNNTPVDCTGDIRTLVDWENYENAVTDEARFCGLFKGCSALTTAPALPATSLEDLCYFEMFRECTNLTTAPTLPATTLAENCYQSMFRNCTSLATAPTLPATTLADYCYAYMFYGCTSLATAPALPAATLKDYCYQYMFYGCKALATAPALPATTLAKYCYKFMFCACSKLSTAPTLPATTLADGCYQSMFYGCTSLATAPALPVTTLAKYCYNQMFRECTNLTTAPALPAATLKDYCYQYMFKNCAKLTTAPALPATTLALSCYYEMFSGCTSLNSITMLATDISASKCLQDWVYGVAATGTFTKAAAMTSLPTGASGIPSGWTAQDYSATPQ